MMFHVTVSKNRHMSITDEYNHKSQSIHGTGIVTYIGVMYRWGNSM